jgi:hypothetical protein
LTHEIGAKNEDLSVFVTDVAFIDSESGKASAYSAQYAEPNILSS